MLGAICRRLGVEKLEFWFGTGKQGFALPNQYDHDGMGVRALRTSCRGAHR